MSRQEANARVLELMDHYGVKGNSVLSVDFFFYADNQDDASNLAIDLSKLGYRVDTVNESGTTTNQWVIRGVTPKMDIGESAINEWTGRMKQLAKENNSVFDGWGTLIDPGDN